VKAGFSKAVGVGVLVAVAGGAFLVASTFLRKGGYSESESYLVQAHFSDATGLTWKSRVQIAGIQVGEVTRISLDGARALLEIRVKNEVELRQDACLYKTFPSALLPDALLEVAPGHPEQPSLKALPEGKREITCVREATSVQQLLDSMAKIAADVQLVTGDLASTVNGNHGSLKNVVENLASLTGRLEGIVAQNGDALTQTVHNARDFTRDLKEMSSRDKEQVHQILANVAELTAQLKVTAASLQGIMDGAGGKGGSRPGSAGAVEPGALAAAPTGADPGAAPGAGAEPMAASASGPGTEGAVGPGATPAAPATAGPSPEQAKGVQQAVAKLNDNLEKLDTILGKVQEGKSVAGKLLVDERMGRKVGQAVDSVTDYFDRLNRLQIQLRLRSEWLLNQSVTDGRPGAKVYFGARIFPKPDKYYELELVSDPRGVDTVTTDTITSQVGSGTPTTSSITRVRNEQKLTFSAQLAKRFGLLTLRGGVIESSGGVGADVHLFDDSLGLSLSAYQFTRAQQSAFPRAKFWVDYNFLRHFYLTTGVDDFLNRWKTASRPGGRPFSIGTDVFFGAGFYFTDDDLKTLVGSGAGSAASSAK
jgi:phospholipid/cholesterol/gamma-HCH transport system substrate-binding protein